MKRKAFKRHRKRVQRAITPWLHVMGLGFYSVDLNFYDKEKEFRKAGGNVAVFRVWADWRYLSASIAVNVKAVARLDDDELERAVVHELIHVLVNEMREPGIDHEERVVTMLSKAFFWTRANAVEQFGEKNGD